MTPGGCSGSAARPGDHTVKDELSEALLSYDGATLPRTVVGLSGVTFTDSSGINVFVHARHQGAK
ncbi:hypothetical protein ACWD3Z_47040 [Streptomyces sp. NPDC002740]